MRTRGLRRTLNTITLLMFVWVCFYFQANTSPGHFVSLPSKVAQQFNSIDSEEPYEKLGNKKQQKNTKQHFTNGSDCIDGQFYNFEILNEDRHVHQLKWLCIHSKVDLSNITMDKIRENRTWYIGNKTILLPQKMCSMIPTKQMTLYHSEKDSMPRFSYQGFNIVTNSDDVPDGFTISNSTAYFLGKNYLPFAPENLYHFFKQVFVPLYFMMKLTDRLKPNDKNVVFYGRPLGRCPGKFYRFNLDYAKPFYKLLNIVDPYTSAFEDLPSPDKVCYRTAVFSKYVHINHAHEALEFVKSNFNASSASCQPKVLTLIGRKSYRRILNLEDLQKVAESLGYNAKVVYLEKLTFAEQIQLIHCTEVLVGVTGAGLQWAYFMKNHSGVVEIAWPQFHWPFFFSTVHRNGSTSSYSNLNGVRPLRFSRLKAARCHLNPASVNMYHKAMFSIDTNLTKQESVDLLKDKRNYDFRADQLTNLGKLCDVTVDPEEFRKALLRLDECK